MPPLSFASRIAFSSANASLSARAASTRFWASSFFLKSSSLPEMLASHHALFEATSSGRTFSTWAATNFLARAVAAGSAAAGAATDTSSPPISSVRSMGDLPGDGFGSGRVDPFSEPAGGQQQQKDQQSPGP